MSLEENDALEITAVRALESVSAAEELWTGADRGWATRAAAEIVGEESAPEAFLAARARLALDRIGERRAPLLRLVRALRWRPWVGTLVVAAAFIAGIAFDHVGGSQRINLLAPPFFFLLVWNLAVYALLAIGFVARFGEASPPGPMRRLVQRLAGGRATTRRREWAAATAIFGERWSQQSAGLYAARAARVLHVAAVAFAAGVLGGLYLRGIAFEYRATWESTFLGADAVHALLATTLAPGAAVTGIPVASLAEVEAIRAPGSENAARWLHLIAATVALVVIAPRLALALWAWLRERQRARHMPIALDEPYFARLLREFRGGPASVRVVPYSYALPAAVASGLERIVRSVFGPNASLTIAQPVAYGGEDALETEARTAHVIALFNATATPERETHGAFLAVLRGPASGGTLVALVDESAFGERWGHEPERLRERRSSWSALCAGQKVPCVFASLRASDAVDAAAELERAVEAANDG